LGLGRRDRNYGQISGSHEKINAYRGRSEALPMAPSRGMENTEKLKKRGVVKNVCQRKVQLLKGVKPLWGSMVIGGKGGKTEETEQLVGKRKKKIKRFVNVHENQNSITEPSPRKENVSGVWGGQQGRGKLGLSKSEGKGCPKLMNFGKYGHGAVGG